VHIILIFIDGLGIGEKNPIKNPCTYKKITLFNNFLGDGFPKALPGDGLVKPIDCQLGIAGLPQSATGQTALYTGQNAAQILGKHLSGFPNQKLRDLLADYSISKRVSDLGKKAAFINAYRPIFFERGPEALLRFLSVTSIMNWKAGLKFFNFENLRAEKCIYHDFTNRELIRKKFRVPKFSAEKAGEILAQASNSFDFLLYEYFKTDRAGHKQDFTQAAHLLIELEKFIFAVLKNVNLTETMLVVTSDHGNIEDVSLKTHTKNPLPLMVWGDRKKEMLDGVESILSVTQRILEILK